jgi:hypothetical protein
MRKPAERRDRSQSNAQGVCEQTNAQIVQIVQNNLESIAMKQSCSNDTKKKVTFLLYKISFRYVLKRIVLVQCHFKLN